jgi:hypothetical protein
MLENFYLKKATEWEKIVEEAKIYELSLPKDLSKIPDGQVGTWTAKATEHRWILREAIILEITKVWSNPNGTIKAIVAGNKDMKGVALVNKNFSPSGFNYIRCPERFGNNPYSDVFDNLKEGNFLVVRMGYGSFEVLFASAENDINKVFQLLDVMEKVRVICSEKYHRFKWDMKKTHLYTEGTVSLKDVLIHEKKINSLLKYFKWKEKKDSWELQQRVKKYMKIRDTKTFLEVDIKCPFDDNRYYVRLPKKLRGEEKKEWHGELSVFDKRYWVRFVERENTHLMQYTRAERTKILLSENLLNLLKRLPREDITLAFNSQKAIVKRKETKNKAILTYVNGVLVPKEDLANKLFNFFISKAPITPKVTSKRTLSKEAMELIEKGLNGFMRDLEGDFPFHLEVIYKEKEKKWYLSVAGREFYIKGGYNALKKVKSALEGRAIGTHEKYGWGKQQTLLIRDRIAELVGKENATWIVLEVKKMGALMRAISSTTK